ncbi:MAG TPA: PKD domain-containing protein, partial [Bacteroidia bacterium]|nr:PKD domain-containing protein [Bacteroidia bacterium]
ETASSYTWSTGSNNQTITINSQGTYWVQIQPQNGCRITDTIHVSFTTPPIINLLKDTIVCSNINYVLNASQANAINYVWSTGAISSSIIPSGSGIYWVDINLNQCIVRDSATINILNSPTLSVSSYTVCNGQSLSIIPIVSGGLASYSFNWGNGYNGSSYITIPHTDSIFSVSVTDANGCSSPISSGSITVLAPLKVNVSGIKTCSTDTTSLLAIASGGSGNYVYTWNPSNSHQNPLLIMPQGNTIYTVTISDGCTIKNATDTALVTITQAPIINLPPNVSGCSPVCINLASIPYNILFAWQWDFGDGNQMASQKNIYCYNKSGSYNVSLTYTTNLGCVKTVTSNNLVTVFPFPNAAFAASVFETDVFNTNISFYNESSGYTSSQWYFGELTTSNLQNPSHNFTSAGNYPVKLVVKNQEGCIDTVIHDIIIKDIFTFYSPNAFTPNGDGVDEVFLPLGTGWNNSSFKMLIFDRWGSLITSTNNPNQGWDGKVKEQAAQEDIYIWKVELKDVFNKSHSYSGTTSLIK